jgi:hypothetical protein
LLVLRREKRARRPVEWVLRGEGGERRASVIIWWMEGAVAVRALCEGVSEGEGEGGGAYCDEEVRAVSNVVWDAGCGVSVCVCGSEGTYAVFDEFVA